MKNLVFFLFTLLAGRVKRKYRCSQTDLYSALLLACEHFEQFQSRFIAFSEVYTLTWLVNLRNAIAAAMSLPGFDQRNESHEVFRVQLFPAADRCLAFWQDLKSHISKSFPVEELKAHLEAAGSRLYEKAANHDWDSVRDLMYMGNSFITDNLALLTAGGMPASFQADFATAITDFEVLHIEFLNAEGTWQQRDDKITANNDVYTTTMTMLKDGQKIFRLEPGNRKFFVFSKLLDMVHGGDGSTTPAKPRIKIKTNGGLVNFGARLLGILSILWGDDTSVEYTGNPDSVNFIDKVYTVVKLYTIIITGKLSEIVELHISDSNLTYFKLHKSMKKLKELILQNNLLPTKVVDQILVDVNKLGTSGPDRVLNLMGNEPPSAAGLAAKAELESRGWVVLVS